MKSKKIMPWIAVVLWMTVIFLFSAQTGNQSGNTSGEVVRWFIGLFYRNFGDLPPAEQTRILEIVHLLIRKGAHFTEYAVLAMLAANAIRNRIPGRWWFPIAFSSLYAVTDEIHQYFVPERACRFLDVCIDTAGAAFGTALFLLLIVIKNRISPKR